MLNLFLRSLHPYNISRTYNKFGIRTLKTNAKHKKVKNKDTLAPKPFQYGKFGGLAVNKEHLLTHSKNLVSKITTFEQLKLLPDVRTKLKELIAGETILNKSVNTSKVDSECDKIPIEDIKPTPIQVTAIQKISKKLMDPKLQVHMLAAETGSGKTMAYIFPLVDYLKRQENEFPEMWEQIKNKAIIRAIILVPTHELVEQVYGTISKLNTPLGLNTFKWDSGTPYPVLLDALKNRIDIMVTTPGKILSLFNIRMINRPDRFLSQAKFVVMDEADTLMDQSWVEDTYKAIKLMQNANHLVFCSATIPAEFEKAMDKLFPTLNLSISPNLHKINKSSKVRFIDASLNPYKGSKIKALAQTLYAIMMSNTTKRDKRCIVFVNEKKSVGTLVETLRTKYGHDVKGISSADTVDERLAILKEFNEAAKVPVIEKQSSTPKSEIKITKSNISMKYNNEPREDEEMATPVKVLVTTDLLARGMNFKEVNHVILYDIPDKAVDLVHRVGRTGRMNQSGTVYLIADKKAKSWAKGLPSIVKKNIVLQ
ncbi:HER094Cp [Eremothecium sinecaudum]|uniref:HER094Cp n=1 Tax=Eremothecium sinecaudum TaxID=45286 RepID=A0A109UZD9_9SACH|nr:HER094Cp [Eremothecium sinecaudum]AMD21373.1 HER094Cp [Eremothecium sinecaudum]